MDRMLIGAILLGVGFLCIFLSLQTWMNIQKTLLYEVHQTNSKLFRYHTNSHIGLGVLYFVFAMANCTAPSKIGFIREKIIMVVGGLIHWQVWSVQELIHLKNSLFIASFFYDTSDEIFYAANVLVGIAGPMLWVAQSSYLTQISNMANIQRNSSIFWGTLQLSLPVGNGIVFFLIRLNNDDINEDTGRKIIGSLSGITFFGTFILLFLPRPRATEANIEDIDIQHENVIPPPSTSFKETRRFFFTKEIVLLWILFVYAGMELAFRIGIYSPVIGFVQRFPNRKELVALSGILIGVGEILSGFIFGILSLRYQLMSKFGCYPIVILGFLIHSVCYFLIYINIPGRAMFGVVNDMSSCIFHWCHPNSQLALGCSFGLGFADACLNIQIYTLLSKYYQKFGHHGTAFAVFKFLQCMGAGTTFCYSSYLNLKSQICILFVFGLVGTFDFYTVERIMCKKDRALHARHF